VKTALRTFNSDLNKRVLQKQKRTLLAIAREKWSNF